MLHRILTAVVLLTCVFLGFTYEPFEWMAIILAACIAVLCAFEVTEMMNHKGVRVYRRVAAIGVAALMLEAAITGMQFSIHLFGIAVCAAWVVRMRGKVEGAFRDVSATCFALAYIGIPMAAVVKIFFSGDEAQAWLLFTMCIIWTTDSFALFTGKLIGKNKMWPKISPGKTWEGTFGGIVGATLISIVAWKVFPQYFGSVGTIELVLYTVCFSIIGQLGDLAESLMKRDAGVKDSGTSLTGHGGFLDLMDAVLFAAIPLLVYLELFHPDVLTPLG